MQPRHGATPLFVGGFAPDVRSGPRTKLCARPGAHRHEQEIADRRPSCPRGDHPADCELTLQRCGSGDVIFDVRNACAEIGREHVAPRDPNRVDRPGAEVDRDRPSPGLRTPQLSVAADAVAVVEQFDRRSLGSGWQTGGTDGLEREPQAGGSRQSLLQMQRKAIGRNHVEADAREQHDASGLRLSVPRLDGLVNGDLAGDVEIVGAGSQAAVDQRLGGRVEDRALHVVEQEAEFVRSLFRRYLEVGSVVRLKTALDAENIRSPVRISGTGKRTGGVPISRGHLYWILSNPIYVGRLRHKGQIHDGLHPAIIDLETWDRVQQKLESQTRERRISQPDDHSFLAGKLYDDRGNRMSSSHASKGGRRWRYYVSRAALTGRKQDAGSIVRVPASEIENRITRAVGTHLAVQAASPDGS